MAKTLITIITGVFFLCFIAWIFWMIYWVLGKFGIWKWATYHRLKKKFKNLEFREDAIEWCNKAIERRWQFRDVRKFVKSEPAGSELLYTFMVLNKIKTSERRNYNDRPSDNKPKEEIRRTFFKNSTGESYS